MIKDIRGPLRGFLLADSAIAALVEARVYPRVLPQGIRAPSLVYNRISAIGDHHMEGPSGLATVRMQIDAWATTADEAAELAAAVKWRLDGYRGEMLSAASPPERVFVQGAFFETMRDDVDAAAQLHRESQDYMLHFEER